MRINAAENTQGSLKYDYPGDDTKSFWVYLVAASGYGSNSTATWYSYASALLHICAWIATLIFEVSVFQHADHYRTLAVPDVVTYPYSMASLILLVVTFGIVVGLQLFHTVVLACNGPGIAPRSIPNAFIGLLTGLLRASMLFTIVIALFSVSVTTANSEWRDRIINLIVFKFIAMSILEANIFAEPK